MTNEERNRITEVMNSIEQIAAKVVGEPFDPKVEVMLELAHALLVEQIELEKVYDEWGPPPHPEDRFFNDTDLPSVDDLNGMWEGE